MFLDKFLNSNSKKISSYKKIVDKINSLEEEVKKYTDADFAKKTQEWKSKLLELPISEHRKYLDEILPLAFAVVREASLRTVKVRHYDVQLMAGIALHQGKIAEQKTGEGKTLTATLPLYLNSLTSRGCHLVTPNDYLAKHGAGWYGDLYFFLGLSVGVIAEDASFIYDKNFINEKFDDKYTVHLKPCERVEAYRCDIVYGTNHEYGFDYLRDNMENNFQEVVQTNKKGNFYAHYFAIVDEVDSILIDEARTPLIISSSSNEKLSDYIKYSEIAKKLEPKTDYEIDEKIKSASLSEIGLRKVEKILGIDNLYETDFRIVRQVENALRAHAMYLRDKDYVVKNGEVKIVDEFTGRILERNRYSAGLHQAIEAKEGVEIQPESRTLATISYQNYFRLYEKLAGMTGTAKTEEEEFYKIYGIEVVVIPTNKPTKRRDHKDVIYKTISAKFRAIATDIKERHAKGQPVLIGTTSVEKSELLASILKKLGVPHKVLNAKQHEKEALVIQQAGKRGAVTVATNMAGRGVDIILGGDPSTDAEHEEVKDLGGLYVIGTERHESRRIDNQLRGRAGRQGDNGESRFYISLQDDLMRIFGGEQAENMMNKFGIDDTIPLSVGIVSRAIEGAQKRVEGYNFDLRKGIVQYDDVLNVQREIIYKLRRILMQSGDFEEAHKFLDDESLKYTKEKFDEWFVQKISKKASKNHSNYSKEYQNDWYKFLKIESLNVINSLWMEHIDTMSDLRDGINLRAHGQMDPLVEYKREGKLLFEKLISLTWSGISGFIENVRVAPNVAQVKEYKEDLSKAQYVSSKDVETGVMEEQRSMEALKPQTYVST
ncbi:preprotein translocase subunit SecA, partial [Patescibacteria group bacterium]|nr:preprotein translocase subunit SecA [Patescibacteria group bacterium]